MAGVRLTEQRHHIPVTVLGRCIHECPSILKVQRKPHHLDDVRQIGFQAACTPARIMWVVGIKQHDAVHQLRVDA